MNTELACPACRSSLEVSDTAAHCAQCGAEYAVDDGILCTDRSGAFLGEFGAARMMGFVQYARDLGWREAVERMCQEDPGVRRLLLGSDRASFVDIFGVSARRSVLDLGAGLGAISLDLSKGFEQVFSVDLAYERLALVREIAKQREITNVRPVCHRDVFKLPFASDSLDAVVMVGVFEYFPGSYPDLPINEVQSRALAEIGRILAPGGVVFMATKNRFGWPHWAGATDNSGLRFGPLLPRPLADLASRLLMNQPFRVISDSLPRYRSLFTGAGFAEPRFYWPVNGYQSPRSWVDLKDKAAVLEGIVSGYPKGLRRSLLKRLAALGILGYVVPHFGIVARKPG